MATEEIGRRSPLPPYNPQLIFEAIDELNQKEGANMSAISEYIESKYGDLLTGHSNLLSATLYAMKETGEIIFLENNYLRPDPNYSVRPGRGRLPKPKDPLAEAVAVSGIPKSRGRPRKDPNGPPGEVIFLKSNYLSSDPNISVRRRRPKPKHRLAEAVEVSPSPKSRGRPKKDPNAPSATKKQKLDPVPVPVPVPFIGDEASPHVSKMGRLLGRPIKASIPLSKTGRPRGRPMKAKPQALINGVGIKGQANLLSAALYAMKKRGEVNFLKNKYHGPDTNNPVSRGHGRPPKPKDPPVEAAVDSGPPKSRSRGRPKKDANVPPTPKKRKSDPIPVPFTVNEASPPLSKTGRPRGRPVKVSPPVSKTGKPRGRPVEVPTPVSKTGKPRGRPIKASTPVSKTGKPQGRPIKVPTPVSKTGKPRGSPIKVSTPVSKTGRPRGRPRKLKPQVVLNGGGIEEI